MRRREGPRRQGQRLQVPSSGVAEGGDETRWGRNRQLAPPWRAWIPGFSLSCPSPGRCHAAVAAVETTGFRLSAPRPGRVRTRCERTPFAADAEHDESNPRLPTSVQHGAGRATGRAARRFLKIRQPDRGGHGHARRIADRLGATSHPRSPHAGPGPPGPRAELSRRAGRRRCPGFRSCRRRRSSSPGPGSSSRPGWGRRGGGDPAGP